MIHLLHDFQIDRYFGGGVRPAVAATVLRRIWHCAACRARYERHLLFERVLPGGEQLRDDRLWRTIQRAAGSASEPANPEHAVPRRRRWAALVATSAVALLVLGSQRLLTERHHAPPSPRGEAGGLTGAPTLHLFRTISEHETEPVERTIRTNEGILMAYSNPGSALGYLMVFAVDARGNVHWYYPAYERPGENPAAAPIQTRALGIELGEEIRHSLPPGDLRMFALFLPRPWHVDEIERIVAQLWGLQGPSLKNMVTLPINEGEQASQLLEVTP